MSASINAAELAAMVGRHPVQYGQAIECTVSYRREPYIPITRWVKLRCVVLYLICLTFLGGAAYNSFFSDYITKRKTEVVLTWKWEESHKYKSGVYTELMGRWEGKMKGVPFVYETKLGNYTYHHVPVGTEYRLDIAPRDVDHENDAWVILSAIWLAVAIILGGPAMWFSVKPWFVDAERRRKEKECAMKEESSHSQ
ncbi:hypothetical protein [Pseudomonas phage vB_PaeM_PS119XW]|uniref:Uncharacterized protein n=1 Tax=Pseudomonas phage vB_PaeM_PS119XW TaxID=2601632 RepID=A0A5C1K7T1_9CAUD|nr:hypothetical protein PP933_gp277 [Pseudomonas phage vB_PaeM_PS119XW]QEM42006.1 hypothetical protein [Pseudomonas phage vB_PaeM_PS119XW]